MKNKLLTIVLTFIAVVFAGCAYVSKNPAAALILEKTAARIALNQLSPAQQVEVRNYISSTAMIIRAMNPAHPLDTTKLDAQLRQWLPKKFQAYSDLIDLIVASYSGYISTPAANGQTITTQKLEEFAQALDVFAK